MSLHCNARNNVWQRLRAWIAKFIELVWEVEPGIESCLYHICALQQYF